MGFIKGMVPMGKIVRIPTDGLTTFSKLEYEQKPNAITIEWLETESGFRRQGHGSEAVRELRRRRLALNVPIFAYADNAHLSEWYKKLGFAQTESFQFSSNKVVYKLVWHPPTKK